MNETTTTATDKSHASRPARSDLVSPMGRLCTEIAK
jgi:hypothetical protein